MITDDVREYCASLSELGVENTPLDHPESKEIKGVLDALGITFSDCVPSLIMKADGSPVVIVIRGDTRADFKKIKKALAAGDLRMASPDEFGEITGVPVGAARVYNPGVRTLIDKKVFEKEYLTGGSGRFDCSIRVKTADLGKLPDSEVLDVSKES